MTGRIVPALVSRIARRTDGRWEVEVSVRPGQRVVTVVQGAEPSPELIEHIRRTTEERFSHPGPQMPPYAA